MSTAIVKVSFHGDELEAVEREGRIYVSPLRICEALGVDWARQRKKLSDEKWATMDMMSTVGADGKLRKMQLLDLRSLPIWLASINPRKVSPAVREKLITYQQECADVLAEHFLGPRTKLRAVPECNACGGAHRLIGDDPEARREFTQLRDGIAYRQGVHAQAVEGAVKRLFGVTSHRKLHSCDMPRVKALLIALYDGDLVCRKSRQAQLYRNPPQQLGLLPEPKPLGKLISLPAVH